MLRVFEFDKTKVKTIQDGGNIKICWYDIVKSVGSIPNKGSYDCFGDKYEIISYYKEIDGFKNRFNFVKNVSIINYTILDVDPAFSVIYNAIVTEICSEEPRYKNSKVKEKDYQNMIVENWCNIEQFKNYNYIGMEYKVETGRIDIIASCNKTNRPIIIELKINDKRPDRQLLDYARYFNNPILIGLSTQKFKNTKNIKYYTYNELNIVEGK